MNTPDEIVHQSLRLKILAALKAAEDEQIEFVRLRRITGATDGNLGRQLKTLAEAGYVSIEKDFHRNRPRTRASLTAEGAAAFSAHVRYLKSLIEGL